MPRPSLLPGPGTVGRKRSSPLLGSSRYALATSLPEPFYRVICLFAIWRGLVAGNMLVSRTRDYVRRGVFFSQYADKHVLTQHATKQPE